MITFSDKLKTELKRELEIIYAELNGEIDGAEEVVGDNLIGEAYDEFQQHIEEHGFEAVTAHIKATLF